PAVLKIGDQGKISGHVFTVIGRVIYEQHEGGYVYPWEEYQLYNPNHGYIFLSLEVGHWTLFRAVPLSRDLPDPREVGYKQSIRYKQGVFKAYEVNARAKIAYVEGELSWIARQGSKIYFMDAIS